LVYLATHAILCLLLKVQRVLDANMCVECLLIVTAAAEADPDTGAMLKLFEAFLARLPNSVNRELVDSVSYLLYKVAVA
jgi:hypothetical protein